MAFSFTYSKIFSRQAFSRTFFEIQFRDRALRLIAGPSFLLFLLASLGLAHILQFRGLLLAPFIPGSASFPIPLLLLLVVAYYFCAWIADESPRHSRLATIWLGGIFLPLYIFFGDFYLMKEWLVRIPFFLYVGALPSVAWLQLRHSGHDSKQDAA